MVSTLCRAVAVALALLVVFRGQAQTAVPPGAKPPLTEKRLVVDEYHGVRVNDDFRWLENWSDPAVRSWSAAQNAYARTVLDALPAAPEIRARLETLESADSVEYSSLVLRGNRLFALKHQPPKQQPLIVSLASADSTVGERVVIDPNEIDNTGATTVDWFVPSADGSKLAVSMSKNGTESGDVHVIDANTGARIGEMIPRVHGGTAGGSLAWKADGSGFYYTRYPRDGEWPAADMDFFQRVFFHRLGSPTTQDEYQIGKEFPRIAEIELGASESGGWIIATVANGDGGEFAHYVLNSAAEKPEWKKVAGFADKIRLARAGPDGGLYLLSRRESPRGSIVRTSLEAPSLDEAQTVVRVSEVAIEDFIPTATRLYVIDQTGGPQELRDIERATGLSRKVALQRVASVSELVSAGGDELLFNSETYLDPPAWFRYSPGGKPRKTALFQTSPADFSDCEVVRESVVSKDQTTIPISIIRRTNTKRDGASPTILYGYGGYGRSMTPTFSARRRLWLEQGGVFVVANIRGGGEFGESWHLAGSLLNKQNVFDDFYAAAKFLLDRRYTTEDKLALMGGSNGGLLMGATLTQHPNCCKAVVSSVGIYDMLRVELSPNGAFNVTEFGSVRDQSQFQALFTYSPYHNVNSIVERYPAVLFLTGANDPRVDPMQSRKMVARLQEAKPEGLFLLRTSATAGHGVGSSLSERIEQGVDTYAFLFDQLGVKYAPVARSGQGSGG